MDNIVLNTPPPEAFSYNPPCARIPILHDDDDILIVDKPSGLLTVAGKALHHRDCLENRLRALFPDVRVVHRLDMDTSGVIVLAKTAKSHRHLGLQFERRHVTKTYIALVNGTPATEHGEIDLPLRCDWPNRPKQMVDFDKGRNAYTRWRQIASENSVTRILLQPKTGRSHQLRVHMAAIGHPILGDPFYGGETAFAKADRLCLHAEALELYHPANGQRLRMEAPCPF